MQTGADALAQAIGGVTVRNGNPGSVALGLEACRHVAAGYARAVADGSDREARAEMSLGSLLAGPLDEPLGLRRRPRARPCDRRRASTSLTASPSASCWPRRSTSRAASCADRLERVADALGEPDDGSGDGSRAVAAVHRLLAAAGFPTCAGAEHRPGCGSSALVPAAVEDYCLAVDAHDWSERDVRTAFAAAVALSGR